MREIFSKDLPVDESCPNSCVYWIYNKDEHTDPMVSGYVGVSKHGVDVRFAQHKGASESGSRLHVHRAMRKYKDSIAVKVLILADPEFCLMVEHAFRSVPNKVGTWNIAMGGVVSPTTGSRLSEETKAKISAANSGENNSWWGKKHTEEWYEAASKRVSGENNPMFGKTHSEECCLKLSKSLLNPESEGMQGYSKLHSRKSSYKAWRAPNSDKEMWADAPAVFDAFSRAGGCGQAMLSTMLNGKYSKSKLATMSNNFRCGWVPRLDSDWCLWIKEYEELKNSGANVNKMSIAPWETSSAKKEVWSLAVQAWEVYHNTFNSKVGAERLGRKFGLSEAAMSHLHKKLKSGWIPSEDSAYCEWLEQYKQKETENVTQTIPSS